MKKTFVFFLLLSCFQSYSQQKAQVRLMLLSTGDSKSTEWLFKVTVINKKFDKYWIQDTAYLQKTVNAPFSNLIYPMIWIKKNDKYVHYEEDGIHGGGNLRDKCQDSCCNCIYIPKHDSLSYSIKLLSPYKFKKGQYKMQAYMSIPLFSCGGCDQTPEIISNNLYFTIKE